MDLLQDAEKADCAGTDRPSRSSRFAAPQPPVRLQQRLQICFPPTASGAQRLAPDPPGSDSRTKFIWLRLVYFAPQGNCIKRTSRRPLGPLATLLTRPVSDLKVDRACAAAGSDV